MTALFTQVSLPRILAVMNTRRFSLEGLLNARELGGYPVTVNGQQRHVKKGLIYRSGSPENITKADRVFLENLKIKTTADFRAEGEKTAFFDLSTITKKVDLPLDAGNLMGTFFETGEWLNTFPDKARAEMTKLYTVLPVEALPKYRILFSLLADPSNLPLLFYCSAGKDRTGVASALVLYALGASMDTIMGDYFYSTENLRPYWERFLASQSYMIPYYTVTEEYLLAAFKSIERYGGIDSYITKELGADVNHLRELYTE
jgi:protein-tyrosine phosphatase